MRPTKHCIKICEIQRYTALSNTVNVRVTFCISPYLDWFGLRFLKSGPGMEKSGVLHRYFTELDSAEYLCISHKVLVI